MRRMTIALVAALAPAIAVAAPNQNKPEQEDRVQKVEIDRFESSTSKDSQLGLTVLGINAELRTFFGAPTDRGLLVAQVAPDSPAARAGIRVGDVITQLGSDRIEGAGDMISALSKYQKPQTVPVELVRDHKRMSVQAALGGGGASM